MCSFYLTEIIRQENVPAGTSVSSQSQIVTSKKYATSAKEVRALISSGNEETSTSATAPHDDQQAKETADRLARFKARVLEKHCDKADVECATAIRCLYPECTRRVMCKKYNAQNFNTHVILCHSEGVKSKDIKSMFLTMIAQDQQDKMETEQQEQIDITDDTDVIDNSS